MTSRHIVLLVSGLIGMIWATISVIANRSDRHREWEEFERRRQQRDREFAQFLDEIGRRS